MYKTTHLQVAAYLMLRGMKLNSYEKENGKVRWSFENRDECKKLEIEFYNSEFKLYDSCVRDLKRHF